MGESVFSLGGRVFPLYLCLQYLSGLILLQVYLDWLHRQDTEAVAAAVASEDRWRYCLLGGLGATAIVLSLPFAWAASAAFSGSMACQVFLFQLWVHFAGALTGLMGLGSALLSGLKGRALFKP